MGRGPATGPTRSAAREFWALKDINFTVERGEALGIIGPNGAGKSTLLKVLSRILRPDPGALSRARSAAGPDRGRRRVPHRPDRPREHLPQRRDPRHAQGRDRRAARRDHRLLGDRARSSTRRSSGTPPGCRPGSVSRSPPTWTRRCFWSTRCSASATPRSGPSASGTWSELIRSDVSVVFISHNLEQVRHLCKGRSFLSTVE